LRQNYFFVLSESFLIGLPAFIATPSKESEERFATSAASDSITIVIRNLVVIGRHT
jgi:hypothetical protein